MPGSIAVGVVITIAAKADVNCVVEELQLEAEQVVEPGGVALGSPDGGCSLSFVVGCGSRVVFPKNGNILVRVGFVVPPVTTCGGLVLDEVVSEVVPEVVETIEVGVVTLLLPGPIVDDRGSVPVAIELLLVVVGTTAPGVVWVGSMTGVTVKGSE